MIRTTPYGNSITKDFALKAMENEKLGKSGTSDFLAISFSSTDYVGHSFGPQSIELEDTYLRLDKDIAEILTYLDAQYGKDQVLVFLTADHAVAEVPGYANSKKLPGGVFDRNASITDMKKAINQAFGNVDLLVGEENSQLYFNHNLMDKMGIDAKRLFDVVRKSYQKQVGFSELINLKDIQSANLNAQYNQLIINGYHPARSGDFMILLKPSWFMGSKTGTTHSTLYSYDTHVPLLFYGWKVKPAEMVKRTYISDISVTLANWLHIMEPSGSIGNVITQIP